MLPYSYFALFQALDDLELEIDIQWRREKTNLFIHLYEFLCNTTVLIFLCDMEMLYFYQVVFCLYLCSLQ